MERLHAKVLDDRNFGRLRNSRGYCGTYESAR
jgi:hypothetical protein